MKPNEVKSPKIIFSNFFPIGKFAMMWKGNIRIKEKDKELWEMKENTIYGKEFINHENIHIKQAVSTQNSWFNYYFKYIILYLKNLPIIFGFQFPYKFNAFELEAYANEDKLNYLNDKEKCEGWKLYNTLTLKQKRQYWKLFKEIRKNKIIGFGDFINNHIKI